MQDFHLVDTVFFTDQKVEHFSTNHDEYKWFKRVEKGPYVPKWYGFRTMNVSEDPDVIEGGTKLYNKLEIKYKDKL